MDFKTDIKTFVANKKKELSLFFADKKITLAIIQIGNNQASFFLPFIYVVDA